MATAPVRAARLLDRARNNLDLPRELISSLAGAMTAGRRFDSVTSYCMFIGYPRSGHSLVGSLLDAHPEAVVAHELDALRLVQVGFRRSQIFSSILRNSQEHSDHRQHVYDYTVPNQWQGRTRCPRVIGDKKGGRSTRRLAESPVLLDRLERRVRVPVKLVHVVRNPFDNVATMYLRRPERPSERSLDGIVDAYTLLCDTVATVRQRVGPGAMHDLRHEDLLADPWARLAALARFVGLDAAEGYLADCAGILYTSPNRTRDKVPWTPSIRHRVEELVDRFDFLAGYELDS